MKIEKRVPFIAAIISGVITWVAVFWFMREYFALMSIVLVLAMLLFRFEPWAFIGSFLVGLSIELYASGSIQQFKIIVLLMAIGSIIQLLVAILYKPKETYARSNIGRNMLFALFGTFGSRLAQFVRCPPGYAVGVDTNLFTAYMDVISCQSEQNLDLLNQASTNGVSIEYINAIAMVCLGACLLSPALWTSVFAALSQNRFRIFQLGRMTALTLKGLLGQMLAGFIFWALMLVLGFAVFFLSYFIPADAQYDYLSLFIIIILSIDTFLSVIFVGWSVSWGET